MALSRKAAEPFILYKTVNIMRSFLGGFEMGEKDKEIVNVKNDQFFENENVETEISYAPLVDIYETNDDFILIANMPGVSREDVKLKVENHTLIIFGKVNYRDSLNRKYILNENNIGNYYREFKISESVDEDKIEAKYENGQLTIKLSKHEKIKPRTIEIN